MALLLQAADEMLFEESVIGELSFGSRFRALPPDPVLDMAGAIEFFGFRRPASRSVPGSSAKAAGSGWRWPRSWWARRAC